MFLIGKELLMKELKLEEQNQVGGGVPLFVAIALYGEVAAFSAMVSAMVTHRALTE